ncbi:MAG: PDZ domain-containing protein [Panacibacter sp.]
MSKKQMLVEKPLFNENIKMKLKLIICIAFLSGFNLLMAQATNNKKDFHTFLGVDVAYNSEKTDGLFVNGIYKGYGAEAAGLQRGDILKAINSVSVNSFCELVKTLDKYKAGEKIQVSFLRNNALEKVTVNLSVYPEFLKYNSMIWIKDKGKETEIQRAKLGIDVNSDWEKYALVVRNFSDN